MLNSRVGLSLVSGLLLVVLVLFAPVSGAQTGTFVDKINANHVRVVSYNLGGFNNGFSDSGFQQVFENGQNVWEFVPSNARVVDALNADVWAFQEIQSRTESQIQSALDRADPLPNGASWHVHRSSRQAIASRHPFSDTFAAVTGSPRSPTVATVDLPDAMSDKDFHFVNIHLKAGGGSSNEIRRIADIDRIQEYLREAQVPGGGDDLASDTPFVVLGDYNTASGTAPVDNLVVGDIQSELVYGADQLLDWDDTELTPIEPRHNITETFSWTFRSSGFNNLLDYQVYSDSVAGLAQSFILDTVLMSASELAATGLQSDDVLFSPSTGFWDHLPVVADYNLRTVVIPEPAALVLVVVGVLVRSGRRRVA